jgi:hypothetical protein
MKSTICVAEDRAACEPALKILLLSLNKHCPWLGVNLFYPIASYDFRTWMKKCSQVVLQNARLKRNYKWNIKPQALLHLLDQGFDEVIWIDSDILVTRNIADVLSGLDRETIAVTEDAVGTERDDSDARRARLWGFPVGRILPFVLNTGVLRVTKAHLSLLKRWWELVQSDAYQDCQKIAEWKKRPLHLKGDQDVLTALMTSREFSNIPVRILWRGKHILQFCGVSGYTTAERMATLRGTQPTFIHQFCYKPWSEQWPSEQTMRKYLNRTYVDVSPYTLLALRYRNELDCDTEWMDPHYKLSHVLRILGMGHSALAGLPMAIVFDFGRLAKWALRATRTAAGATRPSPRRLLKSTANPQPSTPTQYSFEPTGSELAQNSSKPATEIAVLRKE